MEARRAGARAYVSSTSHVERASEIGWGRVTVTWATMIIEALHRNDLVMAAKTDRLYAEASREWR